MSALVTGLQVIGMIVLIGVVFLPVWALLIAIGEREKDADTRAPERDTA